MEGRIFDIQLIVRSEIPETLLHMKYDTIPELLLHIRSDSLPEPLLLMKPGTNYFKYLVMTAANSACPHKFLCLIISSFSFIVPVLIRSRVSS